MKRFVPILLVALLAGVVTSYFFLEPSAVAQTANPEVTVNHEFNWLPPSSGTPTRYHVAVDDPSGVQLAPPGTVFVTPPTTKVGMSQFLTGQPLGDGYLIYVRAEDAGGNLSTFLTQPFKYVGITAPQPAPTPFTLP